MKIFFNFYFKLYRVIADFYYTNIFCIKYFNSRLRLHKKEELRIASEFGYDKSFLSQQAIDAHGDPIPWYTFPAIEYLNQFDYRKARIFEYGSGNSSKWWGKRARNIISVENDKQWYDKQISNLLENQKIIFANEPESYAKSILTEGMFDIIIIDGVYRDLCAKHCLKSLNKNGMIIFDNSDRVSQFQEYYDAFQFLSPLGLFQIDFYGKAPIIKYTHCTSVFFDGKMNFPSLYKHQPVRGIASLHEARELD